MGWGGEGRGVGETPVSIALGVGWGGVVRGVGGGATPSVSTAFDVG